MTKEQLVGHLQLLPHPEGGYYRETYRSPGIIPATALPQGFSGARNFSTAIYFLISEGNFSALHRILSDETWHFYLGDALEVIEISPGGDLIKTHIGPQLDKGEVLQYTVKAGNWFGSRVRAGGAFSLVGCTVAPGFDFADFEMAGRNELTEMFPEHLDIICEMTRL